MRNDMVIKSKNIYTGKELINGFIVVSEGIITKIGNGDGKEYCHEGTEYIDVSEGFVTPGLIDTHCFFIGHYVNSYGEDLGSCSSITEVMKKIKKTSEEKVFVGRNLSTHLFELLSKEEMPDFIPVVIFDKDNERFAVNRLAKEKYGIVSGNCNLELYWRLIKDILTDRERLIQGIQQHNLLLSSRGVTSVKEVVFDDSYGFLDTLKLLVEEDTLKFRVRVVSQPVGYELDLELGRVLQETLTHENLKFTGYNMMVDGSMSQSEADLKGKYLGTDFHSINVPDYKRISELVDQVDSNGFRIALHAQGDRAIAKTIDILSKMKKGSKGKLVNKHTMTDLEFGDVEDFSRMEHLGIIGEIYPQIQSIYDNQVEKIDMITRAVGKDISKIWNRRGLSDSGTVISCATDLPLLFPSLPESLYHACGGYFRDQETCFQKENTLSRLELIKAWTVGGAMNLFEPDENLGLLETGYNADLVIYDQSLLDVPMSRIREVKVIKTIFKGKTVYSN